ncbi:uncharacterized protein F4807DRAFT_472954 [Annulohypoxylon truncatum]|uniref:uncharacterized protein n=1 Tax=Annulohypoxylon truncatum TaxID=327061 RepID=UPI00200759B8|nr:uncharacterized protein F4807DRAFT_472954 [Annulohypoxylon truncatum]KAI1211498.1 hypothetical protein F4807DRAFT_472954 [Annulohypoxylon truncatum]
MADNTKRFSRLSQSAYDSPYSRSGASGPHPTGDPYAPLRASAIATLEAMGYDPQTMTERGVLWAEDQDPFGHVKQSRFTHFLGIGFHRTMESFDDFLSEQEYNDMILAKTVTPVVRKYELDIRRPVKYPDSLIIAHRPERMETTRYFGTTSLFSIQQQAIVAEVKGSAAFVDARTGRPIDISSLGGGWLRVYDGFIKKVEHAQTLKSKWDAEKSKAQAKVRSKI